MENFEIFGVPSLKKGSGIHIKKKNRGKFTDYCGGKVTQKCIDKAKKSKNPKLRKRATFAENSRSWSKKHEEGAKIHKPNGHRSILDNGWIPTKELKKNHKLVGYNQNGNKIDYTQINRTDYDKEVPRWNKTIYSQFDSAWGYPSLLGLGVNGIAATARHLYGNDKMQYKIRDKAGDNYWRYRLGLSVDPKHFGEILDDGSVTLPEYVENEIPTDTTILKNRIAANEEFIKNNKFTQKEWDIANGLIKTDKETLNSLRHTYKTGEPVVINEFSYNSRPLLKEGSYIEDNPTPLNMLQNYTIQYNPSDNTMYYRDIYDFNWLDWAVPGKAYRINGAINLNKKK